MRSRRLRIGLSLFKYSYNQNNILKNGIRKDYNFWEKH